MVAQGGEDSNCDNRTAHLVITGHGSADSNQVRGIRIRSGTLPGRGTTFVLTHKEGFSSSSRGCFFSSFLPVFGGECGSGEKDFA